MRFSRLLCTITASLMAAACGARTVTDKTVVIAAGGDADILVPLLWAEGQARVYTELMFDKLADIGPGQNTVGDAGYVPRMATAWSWSADSLAITFTLDPRGRWHDGVPVRASDLRFAYQLFVDPASHSGPGRDLAALTDSLTVDDSLTVTVWYKARTPEQFHGVAYNFAALPEHLLATVPRDSLGQSSFARNPIGNGPFKFVSWDKGVRLELAAFDDFARGRPKLDRVVFSIFGDPATAARAVFAGDADFIEMVGFDDLEEAARQPDIRLIPVRGYDYGFMAFNLHTPDGRQPHPVLADRAVRRALTMAVDRPTLVRIVHDSLARPALGPFSRSQWTADTTLRQLAFDPAAAERELDALGWLRSSDGVRARRGRRLEFAVVTTPSKARVRYAELIQQALARIGVAMSINPVDGGAFRDAVSAHKFDAALFSWRSTPSPSGTRQTWGSRSFAPGSPFNAGGYLNPTFDSEVARGLAAMSPTQARAHFRAAYQAAVDDPPAIWLYDPLNTAAASERLLTGTFQPDAWWQSISSWDVTGPRRPRRGAPATP